MTIKKIVDYVMHTPYNTNRAILTAMLEQLVASGGGEEPDDDREIIYDGGEEV